MQDGCGDKSQREEYISVKDPAECDFCAEKCFQIIKKARETGNITIKGRYDYSYNSYGCRRSKKKELYGVYIVYISGDLFCKIEISWDNKVKSIQIDKCQYDFNEKTDTTIFLKSTILGYFQDKDKEEAHLRAEQQRQQEQQEQKRQETEYRQTTDRVRHYLTNLYNGM